MLPQNEKYLLLSNGGVLIKEREYGICSLSFSGEEMILKSVAAYSGVASAEQPLAAWLE